MSVSLPSVGQPGDRHENLGVNPFTQATPFLINLLKKMIRQENRNVCTKMFIILKIRISLLTQKITSLKLWKYTFHSF
jgi:hypothetical protein